MPLVIPIDIITQAFFDLGVISSVGEVINGAMETEGLARLNQMLSSWSVEETMVYGRYHQLFTLTAGLTTYTIGTAGSLVSTVRPVRITAAASYSGTFRNPVQVVGFEALRAAQANATAKRSVLAEMIGVDNGYPAINMEVFPPPDTGPGGLLLDYWGIIAEFADTTTPVDMPDGYEEALHFNLAVKLYPGYARIAGMSPELAANASNSKGAISGKNAAILGLTKAA